MSMKQEFGDIWVGEKDLNRDEDFIKSAQSEIQNPSLVESLGESEAVQDMGGNRRDFLKMLGFGVGAATVAAGCDIPVKRAIPYVIKPEEIVPGVATYYASTYVSGGESCPVLVKTREGRPIKVEGNDMSSMTHGGTSARVQASVLSLYDTNRLKNPTIGGEGVSWDDLDSKVMAALNSSRGIRIVSHTVISPTARRAMADFSAKYGNVELVEYDPVSSAAMLEANEQSFGDRVIPNYHFDKADLIVSFNADFLGTWISPIEYAHQYAKNRVVDDVQHAHISKHVQVESQMSMTGSNADNRILVKPSQQGEAIKYLYGKVTGANAGSSALDAAVKKSLDGLAAQLSSHAGKSLVVSASNNTSEQLLINAINSAVGSYGSTISFSNASLQRQGDEKGLGKLVQEIKGGAVDAVIFNNCNPVFEYSFLGGLAEAIDGVKTSIALSYDINDTTSLCDTVAPIHHYLESWGDVEAKRGQVSVIQPTISPLFSTRQGELSLLAWAGAAPQGDQPYYEYLKSSWQSSFFGSQSKYLSFNSFWDQSLSDGVFSYGGGSSAGTFTFDSGVATRTIGKASTSDIEISFTEPITIGNGTHANNPWLHEMPDPVTRCAWGNYLAVPVGFDGVKKFKGFNGLKDGDLAKVTVGDASYTLPVVQQFGQMPGTVSVALGYGRDKVGGAGRNIGVNVNGSIGMVDGRASYHASDVTISKKVGKEQWYSSVQYHHTMGVTADNKKGEEINADEAALAPGYGNIFAGYQGSLVGRSIIRKTHVDDIEHAVEDLIHEREHHQGLNDETLYPYDEYRKDKYEVGHHWGLHVDLNACTGCGACTIACMAENNIPVVGKKQVARHQEMAWLRIDRYYYGDVTNPNVVYQPMMCQHCDNAPCENVCPVNATNHSSEGLNQMTYNRCIGTRYCANNCPYKVRRFNWLDYTTADLFPGNQVNVNEESVPFGADNLTRMVLNPDVTVRSRGVIEKCSFCVQKIQEGKLTAKVEGRQLRDGDIKSACQMACPTGALTFGDTNMKEGDFHDKLESPLNMIVLEEINVKSSVTYTMKVNNRDESLELS